MPQYSASQRHAMLLRACRVDMPDYACRDYATLRDSARRRQQYRRYLPCGGAARSAVDDGGTLHERQQVPRHDMALHVTCDAMILRHL